MLRIMLKFLLTRPSRGVTTVYCTNFRNLLISTHTPLAGRDVMTGGREPTKDEFLLTRPSRGVTKMLVNIVQNQRFLLTRPSRGVTNYYVMTLGSSVFLLTRPSRGVTEVESYVF